MKIFLILKLFQDSHFKMYINDKFSACIYPCNMLLQIFIKSSYSRYEKSVVSWLKF